ncbi:MAG TPA: hypothetical protein VEG34_12930 [Thermoanaerobaculia bacterium]|nr:hypothetical protein [Thermoanaerobaculia bacterium]
MAGSSTSSGIRIFRQHELTNQETGGSTATAAETDAAVRGSEVLLTGNHFAAFSIDAGRTFQPISPAVFFTGSDGPAFCCDQAVEFAPSHDLMVWILQSELKGGSNVLRVAVSQGPDIRAKVWMVYDVTPRLVAPGVEGEYLDSSNIAVSQRFLYVTTNLVSGAGDQKELRRQVVLRWPLDKLARYEGFSFDTFTDEPLSPLRAVQGAGDVMYWGATLADSTLRLYSWPESADTVRYADVEVEPWESRFARFPAPDGRNWLGDVDTSVTAGWLASGVLGFAWTAGADARRPLPHVRIAQIDAGTSRLVAEPHLWSDQLAYAYPAVAPSSRGEVAISVSFGGGQIAPSHAVGRLKPGGQDVLPRWILHTTRRGEQGPADGSWGDSVSICPHPKEPGTWVATGYTLQDGGEGENAEILYVHFGI